MYKVVNTNMVANLVRLCGGSHVANSK